MADLSICMMVKDGGKLFRQSLESVRDFDAQIAVLIDNATQDDTAEIAREFGADVAFHDWPDDFAEARNRSLKMAERRWTLVLDHDERVEPADIPRLTSVLADEDQYEAIRIITINETAGGSTVHFVPRFIRTGMGRYKGAKHHSLVIGGNIRFAPGRIYHSGYNLSPAKMKAKNERDLKLLEKQIKEEPYNTYYRRNLIRSLRSKGDTEALLEQAAELDRLVQTYQLPITDLSMQLVMLDIGLAHSVDGNHDQAEVIFAQLARDFPGNPDGWYFLGSVMYAQEKFADAAAALAVYMQVILTLRTSMNPPDVIVETWLSTSAAYTIMADCYLETEEWGKYQQALIAGHMQTQQELISTFSSKLLQKLKKLEAENEELRNPQPQKLIIP